MEPRALTCEQCGAPYLEGVTICYSCGAPIGEAEQPTQPVKVPVHLRARIATVVHAPAVPPMSAGPLGALAKPREPLWTPRAKPLSLALLAAAVVLIIAGVVVLSFRLIPSAVPLRTVYHDPKTRFHFVLPALWQATPDDSGVRLTDSTGISTLRVAVALDMPGQDAASSASLLAENLGIGMDTPVQFAGTTWERREGQITGEDAVQREMVALVTVYNGEIYIIEYSSPATTFAQTNTLVFQPLLRSFAFG